MGHPVCPTDDKMMEPNTGRFKKTHDQVFNSFDLIAQAINMQENSLALIFKTEIHRFVLNTKQFLRNIRKPRN